MVDCIDSLAPKIEMIALAHAAGCRVVSSMGAGGRLDPSRCGTTPFTCVLLPFLRHNATLHC